MHPGNVEKGDLQPIKDAWFTGKEDMASILVDERVSTARPPEAGLQEEPENEDA